MLLLLLLRGIGSAGQLISLDSYLAILAFRVVVLIGSSSAGAQLNSTDKMQLIPDFLIFGNSLA